MKCPHCLENFHAEWQLLQPSNIKDVDGFWHLIYCDCPSCERVIIKLWQSLSSSGPAFSDQLIRPKAISRVPLPPEVPQEFAGDYKEACLVLADSPKASAALSRRCLQNLLREKSGTTKKDLADQIEEVLTAKSIPGYLAESLDAVRNIGNFAAHPMKSKSTGEIVEVEAGEAEWNLDTLEGLFDFYFVQPQILQKKKEELNKKLKNVGKPEIK